MREDSFSDKESKEISILAQIRHKKGGLSRQTLYTLQRNVLV